MKAKTKFMKMFYKLPPKARLELVYGFTKYPMTLNVCCFEIRADTKIGDKILKDLGYKDE